MTELNDHEPIKITVLNSKAFTLHVDSRNFGDYQRQGVVENVKVPFKMEFDSWEKSVKNPGASAEFGFLQPPDLAKFGRSE